MAMTRTAVESEMMSSVGYEESTAILEVEFRNGSVYQYLDVPRERYNGLLAAVSKGRFFNTCVRGAFLFTRVG